METQTSVRQSFIRHVTLSILIEVSVLLILWLLYLLFFFSVEKFSIGFCGRHTQTFYTAQSIESIKLIRRIVGFQVRFNERFSSCIMALLHSMCFFLCFRCLHRVQSSGFSIFRKAFSYTLNFNLKCEQFNLLEIKYSKAILNNIIVFFSLQCSEVEVNDKDTAKSN